MPASVRLCFKVSRYALALLVPIALLTAPVPAAKSIASPDEQAKRSPKLLYVLLNPKGFNGEVDTELLNRSPEIFQRALKDRARLRLAGDGVNPKEVCDKIQITWFRGTITVTITCPIHTYHADIDSVDPRNKDEIEVILMQIFGKVATHTIDHENP